MLRERERERERRGHALVAMESVAHSVGDMICV